MCRLWPCFLALLGIFACVFDSDSNEVDFTYEYRAIDPSIANRPLDSALNIIFVSKDSLQCEFIADVNCGQSEYTYSSKIEDDSTLRLVYVNNSHRICGGIFQTKVLVSAWSKTLDLRSITRIDFGGYMLVGNRARPR